ncbi:hypothetical protein BDZ91DRAFT_442163 [Kalaharituber pfeilii]|nr:hypothetical protein BDZ91DRAFT_442163 [Kalaharituber pfeilii]
MSTYNTTFFDLASSYAPPPRKDEDAQWGNRWHTKMGFQKPSNLDQSISHIKATEYAPFTREAEQPSIASLYIQQAYGGLGRMHQDQQDYGMEDAAQQDDMGRNITYRRSSNSPDRGGVRRPGPEWGNTHFGTNRPRRRSIVESESRPVYDDNAPPLQSFYDELIAEERRQQQHNENAHQVKSHQQMNGTANGGTNAANLRRPLFDNPKAIRVSNYSESRWPEVLKAISPYGVILERFEELRRSPYYEPIPTKVLAESEDEVVRQARLLFTGEGWTKVTFANRDAADRLIAMNQKICIGGRNLVIEAWKPEIHGRPSGPGIYNNFRSNIALNAPAGPSRNLGVSTSTELSIPGALPRKRTEPPSIFDPLATPTPANHIGVAPPEPQMPLSTPGGSRLSQKMRGAKVITLQEMQGGIFKQKKSLWSRLMSSIWGEVGLHGPGETVKESGWLAWFVDKLFGKL